MEEYLTTFEVGAEETFKVLFAVIPINMGVKEVILN